MGVRKVVSRLCCQQGSGLASLPSSNAEHPLQHVSVPLAAILAGTWSSNPKFKEGTVG